MEETILILAAKTKRTKTAIVLASIMAGVILSFACAASALAGTSPLSKALVFAFGLGVICCLGCDLLTGDCLVLAPLLSKKLRARDFALLLLLACIGNLIGTYALALLSIAAVPAAKLETLRAVMKAKLDAPYFAVFCSAILCNLSVCIGVLTSLKSKPFIDKLAVAFPMAMFFVACGFEHIVADFYYAAVYGIQYTVPFLGVVLAGNLIGGMAVACYARFS